MHTVKRLITEFIPSNYNLVLTIDRVKRAFTGTVTITGKVLHTKVMVHAHDLTIESITVDGTPVTWKNGNDDELTINNVAQGEHIVTITYSGAINDQLHGLYPCKYELDGEQKELLATQFESHYAREVFPCVDEPAAKATFDLTLVTEPNVTVIGNMPVVAQHASGSTLTTTFDTTPKMSSYLLAFVIGNLQKATGKTTSGVDVTVYATPNQPVKSLAFALKHSIQTIEFFENYFGVPYPLPKSDAVALPDFSNGAMENWGLITYRESCLLYNPANTSLSAKQYIATVISHELSHQWFGNLVTMAWWDDLWLNESFATIMEYVCVDALYPGWNVWLDFTTGESVYALRRDSLDGVQSVKVPVSHPDEIQSVFDGAIVYAKGARLMQMMRYYVGEAAFRAGLTAYFTAHAYDNTTGSDLWEALSNASGKDIEAFMTKWLNHSGFPVVRAKRNGGNIAISQKQFFIGPHTPSEMVWPVPLDSTQPTLPAILNEKSGTFAIDTHKPFRLNTHDAAHYITHYSDDLYQKILETIAAGQSDTITRAQVIKEQSLLTKSNNVGSETLVDLLAVYKNETNEKVWGMVASAIADLKRFVDLDSPAEAALKKLAGNLARPLYGKLGWNQHPGEPEDDTMLRATIIGTVLYAEDEAAIKEARALYTSQALDTMDPELRGLILATEIRHGDTKQALTTLLAEYPKTPSVDIKHDICDAVTGVKSTADGKKLLNLLKDTSFVRTQDTAMWYVRLLSNRYQRANTWAWLQANWDWVQKTFGGDKSYDAFPRYTAQVLMSRKELNEYTAFFTPLLNDTSLVRAISIGINDITARVELIESDKQAVEQKLINL